MRTSFWWCSILLMALVVAGCRRKDDTSKDDDKSETKKKQVTRAENEDTSTDADDSATPTSANGTFAANLEGTAQKMTFGKAYASLSGMHIMLSNEKTSCAYKPPSDEAWQVEFDIPPGPDQKFFSGHPIGVSATFNSQRIKLKQTWASPHLVTANIEPFKLKEGERVKGTLEFDVKYEDTKADTSKKVHRYTGSGAFDVELCEDWNNFKKLPGLASDAGEGDLAGTLGSNTFKYKTALAHVWRDKANDVDYIESIEFYEGGDVTCTSRFDAWKKVTYFVIRSIGGASTRQKFLGTPQPADPSFSKPGSAPGGKGTMGVTRWFGGIGGRHAWVRFDQIDFKGGGGVKGAVFAENGPDAKPEEQGRLGGKFAARVCASMF